MVDLEKIKKIKDYLGRKPLPKKNTIEGEICKNAYDIFKNFSEQILAEVNKKLEQESKIDLCLQCVNWSKGTKVTEQLWSQLKLADYKDYPFSISLFYTKEDQFLITLEFKDDDLNNLIKKEKKEPNPENYTKIKKIKDLYENFTDLKNAQIDGFNLIASDKRLYEYFLPQDNEIVNKSINSILTLYPYYQKVLGEENSDNTPQNGNNNRTGEPAMTNIPLNQILYGPPGTGKTYNTVVKAMEIIGLPEQKPDYITDVKNDEYEKLVTKIKAQEGKQQTYSDVEYKVLKQSFDEAKKNHQIEFITFHQSYSYEEFVEGIKPYIPKNIWILDKDEIDKQFKEQKESQNEEQKITLPDIKYIGQKGIFRQIVDKANNAPQKEISFDELWKIFQDIYPVDSTVHCKEYKTEYKITEYNKYESFRDNTSANTCVKKDALEKLFNAEKKEHFEEPEKLKYYAENNNISVNGMQCSTFVVIKLLIELEKLQKKPCVLIIDEINRGNISKIFGELITLIEEDKRLCNNNEMTTILPYSQTEFGVPNNLYIIGTMNTADRSIASVDIALRRRFRFIEMMPEHELLKTNTGEFKIPVKDKGYTVNLSTLLTTLNDRISYILDDDHQIGHSYFLKLLKSKDEAISEDELKDVFKYEILPLLNEYFYGDWEKIKAVLVRNRESDKEDLIGKSFVEEKTAQTLSCYCGDKKQYRFRKFDNKFSVSKAIDCIAKGIIDPDPMPTKEEKTNEDSQIVG